MKAILSGLALSTAVFGAQAAAPAVDKDAQTVAWSTKTPVSNLGHIAWTLDVLNCRFGTLTTRTVSNDSGVAVVDVASENSARAETARRTCRDNGLTPGF